MSIANLAAVFLAGLVAATVAVKLVRLVNDTVRSRKGRVGAIVVGSIALGTQLAIWGLHQSPAGYTEMPSIAREPTTGAENVSRALRRAAESFAAVGFGRPGAPVAMPASLMWNAWADDTGDPRELTFARAWPLSAGRDYVVVLDLSALWYFGPAETGAAARPISASFRETVGQAIEAGLGSVTFDAVLVPRDGKVRLREGESRQHPLVVNLKKIEESNERDVFPSDPLESLREGHDEFTFGRVAFKISTRADANGPAHLILSLWSGGRPIDEVPLSTCIGTLDGCGVAKPVHAAPDAASALGLALEGEREPSIGILVLVPSPSEPARVLFRDRNQPGRILKWSLLPGAEFTRSLRTLQESMVKPAVTDEQLAVPGRALYTILFPEESPEALEGRRRLEHLSDGALKNEPFQGEDSPTISFRMTDNTTTQAVFPAGLMLVGRSFIGLRARLEQPLEHQTYVRPRDCGEDWTVVFPPAAVSDAADWAALKLVRDRATAFQEVPWTKSPITSMEDLFHLLGPNGTRQTSSVLVVTSHHDDDTLYFDSSVEKLHAQNLEQHFEPPSIAVLNGCGTAATGATGVIRVLNRLGIDTMIATLSEVEGDMAGEFLNAWSESVGRQPRSAWDVYRDTLRRLYALRDNGGPRYGARVLKYTLLGNFNAPICNQHD